MAHPRGKSVSITRIGNESAKITKEPEAAEEVLDEAVRKFRKRFPAVSVEVHVPDELLLVLDAISYHAGLVQSDGERRVPRRNHHAHRPVRAAMVPWARFTCGITARHSQKLHTLRPAGALGCEDSSPATESGTWGWASLVWVWLLHPAHGGTLEAKNLESGAEFSFCLPLTKEEVS